MALGCFVAVTRSKCSAGVCGKGVLKVVKLIISETFGNSNIVNKLAGVEDFSNDGTRNSYMETVSIRSSWRFWDGYNPDDILVKCRGFNMSYSYNFWLGFR